MQEDFYKEYVPDRRLWPYVDRYWEFKGRVTEGMRFNILPDGCTDFIFTLGGGMHAYGSPVQMQDCCCYFVGAMTTYTELAASSDRISMLGIRFRPCGILRFARLPLPELTDLRIPSGDLSTIFDDRLTVILAEKNTTAERISFIEAYLLQHAGLVSAAPDPCILYAVQQIDRYQGRESVSVLAGRLTLCQRQFERKFKMFTGYTPKEYSRIKQFRHAVELLGSLACQDLLSVAVRAGYYDVPHLSREVRRLAGKTPASFLALFPSGETTLTYVTL